VGAQASWQGAILKMSSEKGISLSKFSEISKNVISFFINKKSKYVVCKHLYYVGIA